MSVAGLRVQHCVDRPSSSQAGGTGQEAAKFGSASPWMSTNPTGPSRFQYPHRPVAKIRPRSPSRMGSMGSSRATQFWRRRRASICSNRCTFRPQFSTHLPIRWHSSGRQTSGRQPSGSGRGVAMAGQTHGSDSRKRRRARHHRTHGSVRHNSWMAVHGEGAVDDSRGGVRRQQTMTKRPRYTEPGEVRQSERSPESEWSQEF